MLHFYRESSVNLFKSGLKYKFFSIKNKNTCNQCERHKNKVNFIIHLPYVWLSEVWMSV